MVVSGNNNSPKGLSLGAFLFIHLFFEIDYFVFLPSVTDDEEGEDSGDGYKAK